MYKYMMTTIFLYRFNIAIQRLTDEDIRNIGIDNFSVLSRDETQISKNRKQFETQTSSL